MFCVNPSKFRVKAGGNLLLGGIIRSMSKEDGYSPHPEKKEELIPFGRKRRIVLALGDPGEVGKDGLRRKKTHRQIAEEVFDYELSELPAEKREERLKYRITTIKATGREFIYSLMSPLDLSPEQQKKTEDLHKEVKLQNKDKNLEDPDSLFDLFEIINPKAKKRSTSGSQRVITMEDLKFELQPEEPVIREWNFDEFMANLKQANEESRERIRREKDHSTHQDS